MMRQSKDEFLAEMIDIYLKKKFTSRLASAIDKFGKYTGLPLLFIFLLAGIVETTLDVDFFDGSVFSTFAALYYLGFMFWLSVKVEKYHTEPENRHKFIRQLRSARPGTKRYIWAGALANITATAMGLCMAAGILIGMHPSAEITVPVLFLFIFLYAVLLALIVYLIGMSGYMKRKAADANK